VATESADVVVVGAGFAGLTAARELERRGLKVVVLEARDRVGGRVQTDEVAGVPLDLGGQWVGPTQERAYALLEELGHRTYPTHTKGYNLLCLGDRRHRYRGTIPLVPRPLALASLGYALFALNRMARRVPLEAPWQTPGAAALDSITLADWIRRRVRPPAARAILEAGLATVYSVDADEISLLHALFYIRSAGSVELLIDTEGGAQQDRVAGGMQPVAESLAATIRDVRLGAPVLALEQDEGGVTAIGDDLEVRARRAVVALPPALAGRLRYRPLLPADRDQLTQRVFGGSAMKCLAVYPEPFWRHRGLSGLAVLDRGAIRVVFDASPAEGRPGVLLGFVEGAAARALAARDSEERRAEAIDAFERLFGPEARAPIEVVDKLWAADEWARGGYAGMFPPGVWTHLGAALRRPVDRLHWAGTETATRWNGYIEGAIRSGERVAAEVEAAGV
jgi:monoamine oxidase